MTWNVHGSARPSIKSLAEQILAASADVVLLQEVQRRQAHALAQRLGGDWAVRWTFKHGPIAFVAEGLAVLSRFPIDTLTTGVISHGANRFTYRRRIAQVAGVRIGEREVKLCNVHFASGTSSDRPAQFARLLPLLAGVEIFGGDFNDTPGSALLSAVARVGMHRANSTMTAWAAVSGAKPTLPNVAIDHLFASDAWSFDPPAAFGPNDIIGLRKLSDHVPVVVRARMRDTL